MVKEVELIEVDIDRAHPEGAPCNFMGAGQWPRNGRSDGCLAGQALENGSSGSSSETWNLVWNCGR